MRHPACPSACAGHTSGSPRIPIVDHLLGLGVTAIELMPVHQFVADRHLVERGLTNYWGYNSVAFLAPHVGYATGSLGQQVSEFKSMVRTLHRAGIEVILDVVYNHTGEGNELGPTLSLRGVDNSLYYRLRPGRPPPLHGLHRHGQQPEHFAPGLVTDSLRYWVTDMHVDGFRFDLAPVLARGYEAGHPSAFFEIIQQDPVLSQVKLIAEPWDAGPDGYQLGTLPHRLGRVERGIPRLRQPLLAWRPGTWCPSSRPASAVRATSTRRAAGGPTRASTSSPATTASR